MHPANPLQAIAGHVESLRAWTYQQLAALQHSNGRPLLKLFGRHAEGPATQCAIFQFQVTYLLPTSHEMQAEQYSTALELCRVL
jgi:hypothetical protein